MSQQTSSMWATNRNLSRVWGVLLPLVVAALALTALMAPVHAIALDSFEVDDQRTEMPTLIPNTEPLFREINPYGDVDWFSLAVEAGRTYVLEGVIGEDEWFDGRIDVFSVGSDISLASDDDGGDNLMPRVVLTAQNSGTWHVRFTGYNYYTTGPYGLIAREIEPASVSGSVLGVGGTRLPNVQVSIYALDRYGWDRVYRTYTDASGSYRFPLEAGTYRIGYLLEGGQYLESYFAAAENLETATDLVVTPGQAVTISDTQLVRWSRVYGTVYNWNGAEALEDVSIAAFRNVDGIWQPVAYTASSIDGDWSLSVAEGAYKFRYTDSSGQHLTTYHTDASSLELAEEIQVGSDQLTINATLGTPAVISGTVKNALNDSPLGGSEVRIMSRVDSGWVVADSDITRDDGSFSINYRSGSYALWVESPDSFYCSTFQLNTETGEPLVSTVGPEGLNVELVLEPTIYMVGTITDSSTGLPYAGAHVEAYALGEHSGTWDSTGVTTTSRDDGNYTLAGLPADTYRVMAMVPDASTTARFHGGVTLAEATPVSIQPYGVATGIDVQLNSDVEPPVTVSDGNRPLITPATITLSASDNIGVASTYFRVDGGEWAQGTQIVLDTGAHTIEFYSVDQAGNTEVANSLDVLVRESSVVVSMLAGTDRYATAVEISQKAYPNGSDDLIVVTGAAWPDGLSAASLAGVIDAPILLVKPDSVPGSVAAEVVRLGAQRVIIIGGRNAVGNQPQDFLENLLGAPNVSRLSGANRYETAKLVAEETVRRLSQADGAWDGTYILASGQSFPDALAASPLSAKNGWPVLLTGSSHLADPTQEFLTTADGAKGLVIGGPAAVPESVVRTAETLTGTASQRISGSTRYDTALAVAKYAVRGGWLDYLNMAVATGENFPDALTSSVYQAKVGSVLLLTPSSLLANDVASVLESLSPYEYHEVTFIGGDSAISLAVRDLFVSHLAR